MENIEIMNDKKLYTYKEVENMFEAHGLYKENLFGYGDLKNIIEFGYVQKEHEIQFKEKKDKINRAVNNCNQKIPKSLIDKLEIGKIE